MNKFNEEYGKQAEESMYKWKALRRSKNGQKAQKK